MSVIANLQFMMLFRYICLVKRSESDLSLIALRDKRSASLALISYHSLSVSWIHYMVTGRFAHGQFARGQFAHGQFAHNYCFFVKIYEFMDKLTISTLHYVKIIKDMKVEKRNKQIIWLCNTTQLGFPPRKLEDPWRI